MSALWSLVNFKVKTNKNNLKPTDNFNSGEPNYEYKVNGSSSGETDETRNYYKMQAVQHFQTPRPSRIISKKNKVPNFHPINSDKVSYNNTPAENHDASNMTSETLDYVELYDFVRKKEIAVLLKGGSGHVEDLQAKMLNRDEYNNYGKSITAPLLQELWQELKKEAEIFHNPTAIIVGSKRKPLSIKTENLENTLKEYFKKIRTVTSMFSGQQTEKAGSRKIINNVKMRSKRAGNGTRIFRDGAQNPSRTMLTVLIPIPDVIHTKSVISLDPSLKFHLSPDDGNRTSFQFKSANKEKTDTDRKMRPMGSRISELGIKRYIAGIFEVGNDRRDPSFMHRRYRYPGSLFGDVIRRTQFWRDLIHKRVAGERRYFNS